MSHDEDLFKPGCRLPKGFTEEQLASIDEMNKAIAFGSAVVILAAAAGITAIVVAVVRAFA